MKLAVAFDHRGVHLRDAVLESLVGHEVVDFGGVHGVLSFRA